VSSSPWVFDQAHYDALNAGREETVLQLLPDLKKQLNLRTALDLGCGLGHYSELLHKHGLRVLGVDGRPENVQEARRRYPHIDFRVADAEDPALVELGGFDLVFCFGLLYHLENPFRVIRSIAQLASQASLMEGIVYPSAEPAMVLLDENTGEDQGLNYLAFYPSEACLAKMIRSSGFVGCYNPISMPAHPDYQIGRNGFRRRSVFAASKVALVMSSLREWSNQSVELHPWNLVPLSPIRGISGKVYRFLENSFSR
jgi:SAM-dependent methyltransferase